MNVLARPLANACAIITLICAVVYAPAQKSAMSDDGVLGFVNYLEQLGEYRRAANELQRLLVTDGPASDSLTLRAGSLYIRSKAPELAELVVRRRIAYATQSQTQLRYLLAHALYRQRRYSDATAELGTIAATDPSELSYSASLLASLCRAEQQAWSEARSDLERAGAYAATDEQRSAIVSLRTVIDESSQLPMKSPLLAGLLSTVIPGLGKVYTGYPTDGLLSLISIATFAYASYDGFSSGGSSSTRGWVFGALAGGLYLGNIYGSALSASIVRDEATRQLQARLRASFALTGIP
ncbi:MAG: tetratricopeptide repeat protein [Candidatus Kapaibacterium sp.]